MKTELKAKFIQHIAQKKREGGFTLIELLVVIIIIGILSAIALPSFLNQANKAKQSEAKQYIASINKGQQAYYAEESDFGSAVSVLGLGIKTDTQNYTYGVARATISGNLGATAQTTNAAAGLRAYAGTVYLTASGGALTSATILCESTATGNTGNGALAATACSGAYPTPL
jgi:type IV pilus assembly protein PilA